MSPVAVWVVAAFLAQGAIALVLLWILGALRVPLVQSGKIRIADIALSREPWPIVEKQVSNAFDNQFQLPMLLYVAGGGVLYFSPLWFEARLPWLFILARLFHAVVVATPHR